MLRGLETLLGVRGSFRPPEPSTAAPSLDCPEQLEILLRELLVDVIGLDVRGL